MRTLTGRWKIAVAAWAIGATLFQLYTASIGFLEPREQRSLHLFFFLPLAFILYPAKSSNVSSSLTILDGVFVIICIAATLYSFVFAQHINMRFEGIDPVSTVQFMLGLALTITILEAIRRAVTPVLTILIGIVIFYLLTTEFWPGMMNYRDMPLSEIIEIMYLRNGQGIFGSITGISTTMVAIFIAFGAFVEGLGLGRLFNNLGAITTGRQAGGPAKMAVLTSGLFGTMSGSATANVFSTGTFTIPMMKRLGYRSTFAGGVETAASVGGQLMPPITVAGAFIMPEFTGLPYVQIITAAALGAVCYFAMLLMTVHFEARRHGLKGLSNEEVPAWKSIVCDLHLLIPIFVLLALLIFRFSPHFSALGSIVSTIIISLFRKHTRPTWKKLCEILAQAGYNIVIVALACVGAGMIVAGLTVTGLVITLGSIITSISGDSLVIAGGLIMMTTLLMGMGLPTSAAYIVTVVIGGPVLSSGFGVSLLAAHMFIFYFAILADATPPVSIASYAAAAIAKCPPMLTGIQAFRMSIAGFIIAFSFLFSPALLLQDGFPNAIIHLLITLTSVALLAAGFAGYFHARLALWARIVSVVCGIALGLSHTVTQEWRLTAGLVLMACFYYGAGLLEPRKEVLNAE